MANVESNTPAVIGGSGSKLPRRLGVILLICVIVLGMGGLGYWFFMKRSSSVQAYPCTDSPEFLLESATILDPAAPERIGELPALAEGIREQKGYENDPNCLYVLVRNALFLGNSELAQADYQLFVQVSEQHDFYSDTYGETIESLGQQVQLAADLTEQIRSEGTSYPFPAVPSGNGGDEEDLQ